MLGVVYCSLCVVRWLLEIALCLLRVVCFWVGNIVLFGVCCLSFLVIVCGLVSVDCYVVLVVCCSLMIDG